MTKFLILPLVLILGGCATSADYQSYIAAQDTANRLYVENRKPLLEVEAQPGQPITGLKAVRVYMPEQAQKIEQMRPNEWVGVASQAVGVAGMLGGIQLSGRTAIGIANSVGNAATSGYPYVQAPVGAVTNTTTTETSAVNTSATQANTTTTLSGRGVIGDGVYAPSRVDSTSAPTVVTQPPPVVINPLVP